MRAQVFELVSKHGFNATAFQTLEPGYSYFFADDACVAYVDTGRAWVVAGAPIAAPDAIGRLATASRRRLATAGSAVASSQRKSACRAQPAPSSARCGSGNNRSGIRPAGQRCSRGSAASENSCGEPARNASRCGSSKPRDHKDPAMREAISNAVRRWLATRGMAPLHFLVQVEPFTYPSIERLSSPKWRNARRLRVRGAASQPAPAGSWKISCARRTRRTARTSCWSTQSCELGRGGRQPLEHAGPRSARREGPAASRRGAQEQRLPLRFREPAAGFKAEAQADLLVPHLSLLSTDPGAFVSLVDALLAFTRGGFLRFGLRSLLRGPTSVLHALTLLLVPWTLVPLSLPQGAGSGARSSNGRGPPSTSARSAGCSASCGGRPRRRSRALRRHGDARRRRDPHFRRSSSTCPARSTRSTTRSSRSPARAPRSRGDPLGRAPHPPPPAVEPLPRWSADAGPALISRVWSSGAGAGQRRRGALIS